MHAGVIIGCPVHALFQLTFGSALLSHGLGQVQLTYHRDWKMVRQIQFMVVVDCL